MLPDDLVDAKDAAKLVGIHVSTIIRWALAGKLRGYRVGGRWRFSRADVLAAVEVVGGPAQGHEAACASLRAAGLMR